MSQKVSHSGAAQGKETPCDLKHTLLNLHTPRLKTHNSTMVQISCSSQPFSGKLPEVFSVILKEQRFCISLLHITQCMTEYYDGFNVVSYCSC